MLRIFTRAVLVLLTLVVLFVPVQASAADPFNAAPCGEAADSAVCKDKKKTGNPIAGKDGLLVKITRLVAYIGGVAAIIMLIIGGIRYIVSNGDPNKVSGAKDTIVNALIGIAVIVLGSTLIVYVVSRVS